MAKNPLKSLTRRPVSNNDAITAMLAASKSADDRTAAIAGAALVEFALEKAILLCLRPLRKTEREGLFEGTAPLATFSAKIRIAYALGIYGTQERHDLTTINAIRNAFAHSVHELTFRSRRVRAKLYGMHKLQLEAGQKRDRPVDARSDYLGVTRTFWLELTLLAGPRVVGPVFGAFISEPRKRARSIRK